MIWMVAKFELTTPLLKEHILQPQECTWDVQPVQGMDVIGEVVAGGIEMDIEGEKNGVMVEVVEGKIIVGDALHPRTGGEVEEADLDHSPPGGTDIKMDG